MDRKLFADVRTIHFIRGNKNDNHLSISSNPCLRVPNAGSIFLIFF